METTSSTYTWNKAIPKPDMETCGKQVFYRLKIQGNKIYLTKIWYENGKRREKA